MADIIEGRVVHIIDEYKIVINKGYGDGVSKSNRFLVYKLGSEISDPVTGESLGILEIVCGEGKPIHIQEHLTTLYTAKQETKKSKTVVKRNSFSVLYGDMEETYNPEIYDIPFEGVDNQCVVRQIK